MTYFEYKVCYIILLYSELINLQSKVLGKLFSKKDFCLTDLISIGKVNCRAQL